VRQAQIDTHAVQKDPTKVGALEETTPQGETGRFVQRKERGDGRSWPSGHERFGELNLVKCCNLNGGMTKKPNGGGK